MKKVNFIWIFLFLSLIFPISINAQPPFQAPTEFEEGYILQFPKFDFIEKDQDMRFSFHVFNLSDGLLITATDASCEFHLFDNEGDHLVDQLMKMDAEEFDFEILIAGGNFTRIGHYDYIAQCNSSRIGGFVSSPFQVTASGLEEENFDFFLYLIIIIIWAMLFLGFNKQDFTIISISGLLMMVYGLYIILNGLDGFDNLITQAFAGINIGIGFYFMFRAGLEMYRDM